MSWNGATNATANRNEFVNQHDPIPVTRKNEFDFELPVSEFRYSCDSAFAAKRRNPVARDRLDRVRLRDPDGLEPAAGRSVQRRFREMADFAFNGDLQRSILRNMGAYQYSVSKCNRPAYFGDIAIARTGSFRVSRIAIAPDQESCNAHFRQNRACIIVLLEIFQGAIRARRSKAKTTRRLNARAFAWSIARQPFVSTSTAAGCQSDGLAGSHGALQSGFSGRG